MILYPAPDDPKFEEATKVHDWRNYVNQALRDAWCYIDPGTRYLIALNAQEIADREEWD